MRKTHVTKAGTHLVYDVALSEAATTSCIVLLPGIPYNPDKTYDLVASLNSDGHDVYFIHYDGTWGSSGSFLAAHPADSVHDFIDALLAGGLSEDEPKRYERVHVIGNSFGGGLALTLQDNPHIVSVVALSPVISYASVHGIETLGVYLKAECTQSYTFEEENMRALLTDQIIAPKTQLQLPVSKLMVFAGADDVQIPLSDITDFCTERNIAVAVEALPHLTFSKVTPGLYQKIASCIGSKSTA